MSEQTEQPRRRRRQPQDTPPPQGSVAKGAILVAVALLIGFALLRDSDSGDAEVAVGADDNPAASSDDGDGDDTSSSTTSTTAAPRPPAEVKVLIANGSDIDGAAGAQTDALEALGYVTADPTNTSTKVPATVVYFTVGYQAEAEALAEAIGAAVTEVKPLPTPAPVDDLQLSNVLVIVGPDIASAG
jgi:hypothetical protein